MSRLPWIVISLAGVLHAAALRLDRVTQIGGSDTDAAVAIGTDRAGNIYIAGNTSSFDFPANTLQTRPGGSNLYFIEQAGARFRPLFSPSPARVMSVAADPRRPGTLYASTERRLLKTTDSGDTWTVLSAGLPEGLAIGSIVIDPSNTDTLYAAAAADVFKSTDGGFRWSRASNGLLGPPNLIIERLAIDPNRPSTVFASSSELLFRSDDGGASWVTQPLAVRNIVFDAKRPGVAYGTTVGKLYKSTDGGANWIPLPPVNSDRYFFASSIAVDSIRPGLLYVVAGGFFYRSADDGASWRAVPGFFGSFVATDPQLPIAYAALQTSVVRSTDGFATWTPIGPPSTAFIRALALAPDAGNPSGPANLFIGTEASNDVFVAKVDPSGNLVYATYVGGSADDTASAMAVGDDGSVYVTGKTWSTDFPITPDAYKQGSGAFVFKLAPDGSRLLYSTLVQSQIFPAAIAVDAAGSAYITGATFDHLPVTPGVIQPQFRGSFCGGTPVTPCFTTLDSFVTKLNPAGSDLVYSTYISEGRDQTVAIAVDSDGNAYVAGASLWKLNPTASRLLYKARAPGQVAAIALDGDRNVFLAGSTEQPAIFFSTPNAFQQQPRQPSYDLRHAFVAKISADGSKPLYSTLLGGEAQDSARSIFVDGDGNAIVAGVTESSGLPTHAPLQGPFHRHTGFVAKLNADGSDLVYSTFVGDTRSFEAKGVAVDTTGNPVFVGNTVWPGTRYSPAVPSPESDIFVVRLVADPEDPPARLDAVLDAASLLASPLSPGERIIVIGSGFSGDNLRVLLDDIPIPILSSGPGQITAVVPNDINRPPAIRVQIESEGKRSNVVLMPAVPVAP